MSKQVGQDGPPKQPARRKSTRWKRLKYVWALPPIKEQMSDNVNISPSQGSTSPEITTHESLSPAVLDATAPDPTTDGKLPHREPEDLVSDTQHTPEESAPEMVPATEELDPVNPSGSREISCNQPPVASSKETSNSLWGEAYRTIQKEIPQVLLLFETILSKSHRTSSEPLMQVPLPGTGNSLINRGLSRMRRPNMDDILDGWLAKGAETEQEHSVDGNNDEISKLSASLRDILGEIIESTPADAIALRVAACYAAEELFLHPTDDSKDDRQGFLYVISRVKWYCYLPTMILGEVANRGDNGQQRQPKLRKAVVSLYKAVLSYLMALVCAYSSHREYMSEDASLGAFIIQSKGINAIKDAECDLPLFDDGDIRHRLMGIHSAASDILKPQKWSTKFRWYVPEVGEEKKWRKGLLEKFGVFDPRDELPDPQPHNKQDPSHTFYDALLSTTEYKTFRDWNGADETNRLLCVSGGPGQGKTMLLTGVVQALLADKEHVDEVQDARQLSFFFFGNNPRCPNHPTAALCSLIWFILKAQPELARHLTGYFTSTSRDAFQHPGDFPAVSAVFYEMVQDDKLKETYLVVDALDQCFTETTDSGQSGIEAFLFLIAQSLALSNKIRWLVSFNSDSDSEAAFRKALIGETGEKTCYLQIHLENNLLDSQLNQFRYIKASVKALAKEKGYSEGLESYISDELCKQPFRNYLWMDTVCATLRAGEGWYAPDIIKEVKEHVTLLGLYEYVHNDLKCLSRRERGLCIQVISTISLLHQPIYVHEFESLLNLGEWMDFRSILQKCSAFLGVRGNHVWFLHPFAKTYIQKHFVGHLTASKVYSNLARGCLDYLGRALLAFRPGYLTDGADYSFLHWISHLDQIPDPSQDTDIQEKLYWFLTNHFLQWIDYLFMHYQLSAAAAKLQKVDLRLQRTLGATPQDQMDGNESPPATVQAMIRDMLFFIYLHLSTQGHYMFPVRNTLAFCPERSLIRQLWLNKKLPRLSSQAPMHQHWGHGSRIFRGHEAYICSVAFSPDGRLLVSGSNDGTARIWNVEVGETLWTLLAEDGCIYSVAFSSQREGSKAGVVAAGSEGSVTLWDANTGRLLNRLNYQGSINSLAFSADARWLAVASSFTVHIRELGDNAKATDAGMKLPFEKIEYNNTIRSVVFSPDGQLLATGSEDTKVRVWSVESIWNEGQSNNLTDQAGRDTTSITTDLDRIQEAGTKSQSRVSSDSNKENENCESTVEPKKPNALNLLHIFEEHTGPINCVVFSADSTLLASCSDDGTSRIWDLKPTKPEALCILGECGDPSVTAVSFLPNKGNSFLASCAEGRIELWDIKTSHKVGSATSQLSSFIFSPAFSPDGNSIAIGSTDKAVHIWYGITWDPGSHETSEQKSQIIERVEEMALSPNGQLVATSHPRGDVRLWDIKTAKTIKEMDHMHKRRIYSMTFSPKGGMLLTGSMDETVSVCQIPSGDLLHKFSGHSSWVRYVAWSHDEKYVASASDDGTARIWKIGSNGKEVAKLTHSEGAHATGVAFSPNGEYLVTSGPDKRVLVWQREAPDSSRDDSLDWRNIKTIKAYFHPRFLAVSPDSKRVVSYTDDGSLNFLAIETGKESDWAVSIEESRIRRVPVWFDARFEVYVNTIRGTRLRDSAYTIEADWHGDLHIEREGKKLISFPKAFGITASLVGEDCVVLGMREGGIQVFSFAKKTHAE
ncbi:WD40 repeat-like protein [Nemania diffusa]|nr:WD40 repeat-like protein [Nemania diffusa]